MFRGHDELPTQTSSPTFEYPYFKPCSIPRNKMVIENICCSVGKYIPVPWILIGMQPATQMNKDTLQGTITYPTKGEEENHRLEGIHCFRYHHSPISMVMHLVGDDDVPHKETTNSTFFLFFPFLLGLQVSKLGRYWMSVVYGMII